MSDQPYMESATGHAIAGFTNEAQMSAQKLADYINQQYDNGMGLRRPHAISWIRVRAFMRGIHYFTLNGGVFKVIPPSRTQIRSVLPIMKPMFRHELGRLNSNQLGVTTYPASGSKEYIYKADRAYNILTHWINEADMVSFFDQANQHLLYEGMVGYYRYMDPFRQTVCMRAIPGSELFPIPYDAKTVQDAHGIMHVTLVTKQWLEQQDALYEAQTGQPPPKLMASKAGMYNTHMSLNFPSLSGGTGEGGKMQGALVKTIWMKPTPLHPNGEYIFLVDDEIFRYSDDPGVLFNNKIPIEIVHYTKQPDDWWGYGFCEELIPQQMTANRQMTYIEHSATYGKGFTLYKSDVVDLKDLSVQESGFVPMRNGTYDERNPPVIQIPPTGVGRDVGATLELVKSYADFSAGYSSGILFGRQEGRTDSGPATNLLNANAQSPLTPTLSRIFEALKRTYPEVLDMLQTVWSDGKVLQVTGPNNLGREITLRQTDFQEEANWSQGVVIDPLPLMPNGRNALVNVLFQLRQIPGQDGTPGSEVTSREFRTSLRSLGIFPPGLELADKPEQRIQARINALINDGVTPAVAPADPTNPYDRLVLEDHRTAVQMIRNVILPESFMAYSKEVQGALLQEFKFHKDHLMEGSAHPNAFDDDIEQFDANLIENYLAAAEADLETDEGEMAALSGLPI